MIKDFKKGNILSFFSLTVLIIIIDQVVKLLVHYNMDLQENFTVFGDAEWFKIHYTLNPGMAFGISFDWKWSKLLLTTFRIVASFAIGYYMYYLWNRKVHRGFIWCMALILAGAIGNVIDSVFYGVFLEDNAIVGAPTKWFYGKVVDMFYFDIYQGYLPDWVPFFQGRKIFLWPIFNIADASIFIGVTIILVFQKRFFDPKYDNTPL